MYCSGQLMDGKMPTVTWLSLHSGKYSASFFSRLNVFKDRKNWLPFFSWFKVICLVPFFLLFLTSYLHWWTLLAAFVYSMIIMGTHGTIWHHRYCTHGAYKFRNPFWRFFTQNLTLNVIPEEIYVISHHVHHAKSDQPGDPYNAQAGFLYCFLADVNHQPIAKDLSETDYNRVKLLMQHTGVTGNTYAQYLNWGSYVNPAAAITSWLLNWSFWYLVFYLIGGHALACSLFGAAGFWAVGVRHLITKAMPKAKISSGKAPTSVKTTNPLTNCGLVSSPVNGIITTICIPKVHVAVSSPTRLTWPGTTLNSCINLER